MLPHPAYTAMLIQKYRVSAKIPEASGNVTTRSMIYQDLTFQAVLVLLVMLPHQTFRPKLNQLEVVTLPHPELKYHYEGITFTQIKHTENAPFFLYCLIL